MTEAEIRELARQGLTSREARVVLEDMLRETGWWDPRLNFAFSNGDDREEFLALLTWPGEKGEHHARVLLEALNLPIPGKRVEP